MTGHCFHSMSCLRQNFASEVEWDFGRIVGVAMSSSAGQRYIAENSEAQFQSLFDELSGVWGNHATRRHGRLPLSIRVGRVSTRKARR